MRGKSHGEANKIICTLICKDQSCHFQYAQKGTLSDFWFCMSKLGTYSYPHKKKLNKLEINTIYGSIRDLGSLRKPLIRLPCPKLEIQKKRQKESLVPRAKPQKQKASWESVLDSFDLILLKIIRHTSRQKHKLKGESKL